MSDSPIMNYLKKNCYENIYKRDKTGYDGAESNFFGLTWSLDIFMARLGNLATMFHTFI